MNTVPSSDASAWGAPIGTYKLSLRSQWGGLLVGLLLLGLGPVLCVGLFLFWGAALGGMTDVVGNMPYLQIMPLILGALLTLMGALRLFWWWRNLSQSITLYEHGFVFRDRSGGWQVLWDEVEYVWHRIIKYYWLYIIPTGSDHVYSIYCRNGKTILLDNKFQRIAELGEQVLTRTTAALLPRYWAELEAGRRVEFGSLALDRQGLYQGNKSLAWSEIDAIHVKDGVVSVSKAGKWLSWASVDVPQIKNFFVFYELARRFAPVAE